MYCRINVINSVTFKIRDSIKNTDEKTYEIVQGHLRMWQSKVRILIVDDDSSDLHLIKSAVEKGGFKTFLAKRGEQALKFLQTRSIHAVIIDIMLPSMDGVSLAQDIRKIPFFKGLIFFISGIFKESDFIKDALKKTNAKEYFQKPPETEDLLKTLDTHLKGLVSNIPAKVDLSSIFSREFISHQKKIRALSRSREISGPDFLCILSALIDTKTSGHINISYSKGLSGITLYQGQIAIFPSINSIKILKETILKEELLTEDDLMPSKEKTNLEFLNHIQELQCVSPHTLSQILEEEIKSEIKNLIKEDFLKYNFVTDPSLTSKGSLFKKEDFMRFIHDTIKNDIPLKKLQKFYAHLLDHPIHRRPEFGREKTYLNLPLINRNKSILEVLNKRPSLREIKSKEKMNEKDLYLSIHFMSLVHLIIFGGRKKIENILLFKNTVTSIWKNIKGKDPFQIFEHLEAGKNPPYFIIERQYQKYRDLHHPGLLPIDAPEDIRKLAHDSMSEVTEAYEILKNERTRKEIMKKILEKKKVKRQQLEVTIQKVREFIKNEKTEEALKELKNSNLESSFEDIQVYMAWAELKLKDNKDRLSKVASHWQKKLIILSDEMKQKSIYHFVLGLLHKAKEEHLEAKLSFSKTLKINENFKEAEKELHKLPLSILERKKNLIKKQTQKPPPDHDIFDMVGNLFKKSKAIQ